MEDVRIPIDQVYVPAKRRAELDEAKVAALAESILEEGQHTAIRVRQDGERYVLVNGLHRLEACRALGEETIIAIVVRAIQH
ncbi:MAG: ParB N-terminal domain-containing protein [Pseudomonadota bacterium]